MTVVVRINGVQVASSGVSFPNGSVASSAPSQVIVIQDRRNTPATAATNLAAATLSVPDDPQYRTVVDLRGMTKCKILADIGGSLVSATKLRVQYHPGGDPTVNTADGGWATLAQTAGSHSLSTPFYTSEFAVPVAAQVNHCVIRPAYYDGDGVADPTIRWMQVLFYA